VGALGFAGPPGVVRTKAIASARVKTDAFDACTLAQSLRADLLPEAYIAPRELRTAGICCANASC
jgi:hypothetical protein